MIELSFVKLEIFYRKEKAFNAILWINFNQYAKIADINCIF